MMSFSRRTQALFWIMRLVRLSPLASTAPLRTKRSPGLRESFSGILNSLGWRFFSGKPAHAPAERQATSHLLTKCFHQHQLTSSKIKHVRVLMPAHRGVVASMAQAAIDLGLESRAGAGAQEDAITRFEIATPSVACERQRQVSNAILRRAIKAWRGGDIARSSRLALEATTSDA